MLADHFKQQCYSISLSSNKILYNQYSNCKTLHLINHCITLVLLILPAIFEFLNLINISPDVFSPFLP